MLFAGIDAGQTATQAAISDAEGNVLGRGSAGGADEIGASATSTRLRDALQQALHEALVDAGLPVEQRFTSIVAGISGYEGRIYGAEPNLQAERVRLVHDAPIAHAGALSGKAGVVVIAGTGSVAYAVDADGNGSTYGGFGYVFGDQGSAFWIARHALALVAAHERCRAESEALRFFGRATIREVFRGFYVSEISRETIASFAPACIAATASGEGCRCLSDPVRRAALELAKLASDAASRSLRDIAFVGGLMRDVWFKQKTYDALRAALPGVRIIEPQHDPVVGALLLARQS